MRAFQFSLQRLLEVKEAQEQAAEQVLARALRALSKERDELRALQVRLQKQIDRIEESRNRIQKKDNMLEQLRYLEQIQQRIERQSLQIIVCEEVVAKERDAWSVIVRERKSLDRLSDREHKRWSTEQKRMEQKHSDEVASIIFARHQQELNGV